MSDRIEREIQEILNRLDESSPREDTRHRPQGLSDNSTANARRGISQRLLHVSRRRAVLSSLVLGVLVAAGLFFGLVYPSLDGSGSAAEESSGEGVGADIGGGAHVDEAWPEGSSDEGADTEEGEHGVDRPSEDHEEHHHGGGDQH